MFRRHLEKVFLLAAAALVAAGVEQSWPGKLRSAWWRAVPPSVEVVFEHQLKPELQRHCHECHDGAVARAELALDRFTSLEDMRAHRDTWERVLSHVRHGIMPPIGQPQPTPEERARLVSLLERTLHPVDPKRPDAGRVVVRRLNREEYRNTVRDLLGVEFDPAADFPEDDTGYGFDNIGSVLSVSPLLLERYLVAASRVANAVITEPAPQERTWAFGAEDFSGGNDGPAGSQALWSNGRIEWRLEAPAAARYRVTVEVFQTRAGNEAARFGLLANGVEAMELRADGSESRPRVHAVDVRLERGAVVMAAEFRNDFYEKEQEGKPAQDRNFFLRSVLVEGPFEPEPVPPGPLQLAFTGERGSGETVEAWVERVVLRFAKRAFRRAPTEAEARRLVAIAVAPLADGESPEVGLKFALQAVLASPSFLFRGEPPGAGERADRNYRLSDAALATRLAYFLWSSTPDDRLLGRVDRGEVREWLHREVDRMLADPKAERFVRNFAGQWLMTRNLRFRETDRALFPDWGPELAASMAEETRLFVSDFLRNEKPLWEMVSADWAHVDTRLAGIYGVTILAETEGFVRVVLPEGRRGGLLAQPAILAVSAYPNRTSPVLRGKFVLEKMLGIEPPPPPANVPSLDGEEGARPRTVRERLEAHRANASCASCHALIDPPGFALENFDAIGRFRTMDAGHPIDASGVLSTGEAVSGVEDLAAVIAGPRRGEFLRNFASTLLTYALGRGLDYYDRPAVDRIVAQAAEGGSTLPAMIHAVVDSLPFQERRGEPEAGAEPSTLAQEAHLKPALTGAIVPGPRVP